jgi:energy-coupling factor transporter ATP-binding protein EcfA2
LDEDVLLLDDEDGRPVSVETLSRGTREQLFLSLRLALADSYARRGKTLPLVLDDVLVNFDTQRAKAAATMLRDFAASGHQLLVFTCHEHVARLFQSLRVEVHELPERGTSRPAVTVARKPAARPPRRKAVEEPPPPPPPEEEEKVLRDEAKPEEIVAEAVKPSEDERMEQQTAPPPPPMVQEPATVPMAELPPWQEDDSEPPDLVPARQEKAETP